MPVIRIVLLLLVVGGLALLVVSNLSPVLPLVFLGMQTPILPLAAWIGMAIAAGALTSFFLQFLTYLQRGSTTQRFAEPEEVPPRTRSVGRESYESPPRESQTPYTPPPPPPDSETPKNSVASDWEERVDEDWDLDDAPAASTSTRQDFDRDRSQETSASDRTTYEAKQQPKTSSQTGSVYSYGYREPNESGVGRPDAVYDANYRIITPPYQKPVEPEDDDEDWGFEDDEDFIDESDKQPKRR